MPRACGYCPQKVSGCYRGHLDTSHQRTFVCGYEACFSKNTRFRGEEDLQKHQNETKQHVPQNSGMNIKICEDCSKRCTSDHAMKQHQRDKHGPNAKPSNPKRKHYPSSEKNKTAPVKNMTVHDVNNCKEGKQNESNITTTASIGQNPIVDQQPAEQKSPKPTSETNSTADHRNQEQVQAQSKLHEYYKTVQPTKEDRIASRNLIRDKVLKPLLDNINQDKENLYKGPVEKAGSTATNTKVNKADEFDFDLHLIIKDIKLDESNIGYTLSTRVI